MEYLMQEIQELVVSDQSIFVTNIPLSCDFQDLKSVFTQYGRVANIFHIPKGQNLGEAVVHFETRSGLFQVISNFWEW